VGRHQWLVAESKLAQVQRGPQALDELVAIAARARREIEHNLITRLGPPRAETPVGEQHERTGDEQLSNGHCLLDPGQCPSCARCPQRAERTVDGACPLWGESAG